MDLLKKVKKVKLYICDILTGLQYLKMQYIYLLSFENLLSCFIYFRPHTVDTKTVCE